MSTTLKYTSADLALMPDNGKRYEPQLHLAATLYAQDALESPFLPGFSGQVSKLFWSSLSV